MKKCYGCFKNTKDLNKIKCSACEKYFCSLCISSFTNEKKSIWKCPDCCASQKKGGDNSSTPVRPSDDNVTLRKKTDLACTASASSAEVKELTSEVRLLTQEIYSLKNHLENAVTSLRSCEKRLDELGSAIASNESRIKSLEDREKKTETLKNTIKGLQQELNIQNQHHLRNELELVGIPEASNENLHHIVLLAIRKVGVEPDGNDIDWVARVGLRGQPASAIHGRRFHRPIVVRFLRRSKRDEIIKAAKTRRNIMSADLDLPGESQKVFYNERLTKSNRELFRVARKKTKERGFHHCWCSQGTIFIRQHEGKPARSVRNCDDLSEIFSMSYK